MKQFYRNMLQKEKIQKIANTIEATKLNFSLYTTEIQKILQAADILRLWGNYDEFENNTWKIKKEYDLLHDTQLDTTVFLKKQLQILESFLSKQGVINERYFQKEHFDFYKTFKQNIKTLEEKYLITKRFD